MTAVDTSLPTDNHEEQPRVRTTDLDSFSKEEYQAIRREIDSQIQSTRQLETLAVGAAAAVYAWLGTRGLAVGWHAWFIPILFPVFGGLRSQALVNQLKRNAGYILDLETEFPRPGKRERYEHYLRTKQYGAKPNGKPAYRTGVTAGLFWLFFGIATIAMPYLLSTPQASR